MAIMLLAALVAVVGGMVFAQISAEQDLEAYEKIMQDYDRAVQGGTADPAAAFENAASGLEKLGSSAKFGYVAEYGAYVLAGMYFKNGQYAKAMPYYIAFADSSSSDFAALALLQAALCAEETGDSKKAVEICRQVEKDYEESPYMDRACYTLGRLYARDGNVMAAREYFLKVVNTYQQSAYVEKATARLFLLGNN